MSLLSVISRRFQEALLFLRYPKKLGYRRRARVAASPDLLISGTRDDRLQGLGPVLAEANGCSVLDVGCHDGTVALAFAAAGASLVQGCDIYQEGISQAIGKLTRLNSCFFFCQADLSKGITAFRDLGIALEFDIVCYLGVHQHLKRQMIYADLVKLERDIFSRCRSQLIVRTPMRHLRVLEPRIVESGFRPVGPVVSGPVGSLRIYSRL
jgi:2-polyprenyl-3-methyl-5-hydroxy-6-metoxy-1,4-benzoquinol methylase